MADFGSGRSDPFADMISIVAGPIAAVIRSFDQLRKGADELMRGLENFNTTMENLNETAARVNRLLNDFEEPVRAMIPQITRTVRMAEDLSNRLTGPIDQVVPGLSRLAETLNSPVLTSMPRDLGEFMEVINDLARRMSPLGQLAEQAGSLFGLRIPGFPGRPATPAPARPAPAATPVPTAARTTSTTVATAPRSSEPLRPAAAPRADAPRTAAAVKKTAAKRTSKQGTRKVTAKKATARKATAKKSAQKAAAKKTTAAG